jgi:hypothetical protein
MADAVHGKLPGQAHFTPTQFRGVLDNTATTGLHINLATPGQARAVMAIMGMVAAPAIGAPAYCGVFEQTGYEATISNDFAVVNIPFGGLDQPSWTANYRQCWGNLLHLMGSETGVNSANTNMDGLAQSTLGGVMWYQITSITGGTGVTLSIDDSATGVGAWATLTGSSVTVATATPPVGGFVALANNQTVKQYTRWQIVFNGGASACTFAMAFVRGTGA